MSGALNRGLWELRGRSERLHAVSTWPPQVELGLHLAPPAPGGAGSPPGPASPRWRPSSTWGWRGQVETQPQVELGLHLAPPAPGGDPAPGGAGSPPGPASPRWRPSPRWSWVSTLPRQPQVELGLHLAPPAPGGDPAPAGLHIEL
ncbi:hypothetical protein NHX12_008704 [Muraenolepis orangiensis]|uniref:Uncharacterized protein n=1 Tax=Muraenolepis orangiensis TaxID=630683 RepID=A0A9Q0IA26_9TELE|nr:hypothetical protein NHX12_008704 [Muraenolepis orangiensis]